MAERMGFEPMKELLLYTLSKRAPSTTRPPLQYIKKITLSLNMDGRKTLSISKNLLILAISFYK